MDGGTVLFKLTHLTDTYYSYYRLVVNSIIQGGTSDTPNISDWSLYGTPEYDPEAHGVDVVVKSLPNVPNTDWLEVYYDAKNYTSGVVQDETTNDRDDGTQVEAIAESLMDQTIISVGVYHLHLQVIKHIHFPRG